MKIFYGLLYVVDILTLLYCRWTNGDVRDMILMGTFAIILLLFYFNED